MSFQDTWSQASADGNDDTAPPDGPVDAALVDTDAFTSKNDKDLIRLTWKSVDGEYTWDSIHGFGSVKAAGFTKGTCQTIGVDIDTVTDLAELGEALKTHRGNFYELEIKRNGEYVNTYVNAGATATGGDLPAAKPEPVAAGAGKSDDEDVPFLYRPDAPTRVTNYNPFAA